MTQHAATDRPRWRGLTRGYAVDGYAGFRALVLGASGFVGRHVAHAAYQAGCELVLAVQDPGRADAALGPLGVRGERRVVDLTDPGQIDGLIAEVTPDVVFNLAGYGVDPAQDDPDELRLINAELPLRVLGALGRHVRDCDWPGQRLVHAGSAFEYGAVGGPLTEDGPVSPTSDYARSKLEGTLRTTIGAEQLELLAVVARLFTVYGPGEPSQRLLPSLVDAAQTGQTIALTAGDQRRDFTYVQDVAAGLLRLGRTEADQAGVVNLASGRLTAVRVFAERAAGVLGIPAERLRFGERLGQSDEMRHDPVTITRLQEVTGWRPPTGIERGVGLTLQFSSSSERGSPGR
ncbi:MAG: NAD-dependent epimerase/dehydratase [Myxococcota bacterium]|nr:NAD-dependent epimerase/dehydratase [Myxococcota bacterium]